MRPNIEKFKRQLEEDMTNVKNIIRKGVYSATDAAIHVLVDRSKVHSGSFVASHRIGIGEQDNAPPTDLKRYDPTDPDAIIPIKCSPTEEAAVRTKKESELAGKLRAGRSQIKPYGKIFITNDIDYAIKADEYSRNVYLQAFRIAEIAAQEELNSIDKKTHL